MSLWRIAEAFLHTLYNLFGAPEDVARQHTLTRAPYLLLREWLRAGEAVMRKLLLIEAAAYPKSAKRPARRAAHKHESRAIGFDHDKPEDWRVAFSCFLGPPASSPAYTGAGRRDAGGPRDNALHNFHSAWPLAERYEALIRVFNDPAPYARRLAARLHARPRAADAVLKHPKTAAALVGHVAFDTLCVAGVEKCCQAWPERPRLVDTS
ncbi:MAG: hypothetical protein DCF16_17000 [Alphaproteobacteria bacterium]|nr:MAG: hypothetical protein DCF16_17000 [Alphaproteobacteria bacterium]